MCYLAPYSILQRMELKSRKNKWFFFHKEENDKNYLNVTWEFSVLLKCSVAAHANHISLLL